MSRGLWSDPLLSPWLCELKDCPWPWPGSLECWFYKGTSHTGSKFHSYIQNSNTYSPRLEKQWHPENLIYISTSENGFCHSLPLSVSYSCRNVPSQVQLHSSWLFAISSLFFFMHFCTVGKYLFLLQLLFQHWFISLFAVLIFYRQLNGLKYPMWSAF